jgi:Na+/H+ antiporter NhaD/arsenite permease-like protein
MHQVNNLFKLKFAKKRNYKLIVLCLCICFFITNITSLILPLNDLVGITSNPERFQWIREKLRPVDHVVYSHLLFTPFPL